MCIGQLTLTTSDLESSNHSGHICKCLCKTMTHVMAKHIMSGSGNMDLLEVMGWTNLQPQQARLIVHECLLEA